jgi:5-methylcytosine-specific restriction endonuclease McrBC GTP-binding regulatory subunit McrB
VTLPFTCDDRNYLIVPQNLNVVATMNSADRSIGHIDVAIRRRFGLYPLEAKPEIVQQVWSAAGDEAYGGKLGALMTRLNNKLGIGHEQGAPIEQQVGHSYFLPMQGSTGKTAKEQVRLKWTYQVQPLLREYSQLLNLGSDSLKEFFNVSLEECLD